MSQSLRFDGQVVIVTGASKGIGRALAGMFAERGATVLINGRTRQTVDEAVSQITAQGGRAVASVGDVAVHSNAKQVTQQALDQFGRIDVVVNNAGALGFTPFESMTTAVLDEVLDVNLRGAFNITQAAWPTMMRQHHGRVLMFPSQGIFGAPATAHYALSKAGLIGLTRALSVEGRPHGINVNAVMPFAVTEMLANAMASGAALLEGGGDMKDVAAQLQPEMIAPLVGWLAHSNCDVTGEMFTTGGGHVARVFVAQGPGYHNAALSPELVRDHWSMLSREDGYTVPLNLQASLGCTVEGIRTSSGS
jgi:NAD(P)-dependent dehydrogenase (short-subunit alcohol dehydrogenase family)